MTPIEFDILDELYFPQTPAEVADKLNLDLQQVLNTIEAMVEDGLIKPEEEQDMLGKDLGAIRMVATKKGLLAHNGLMRSDDK